MCIDLHRDDLVGVGFLSGVLIDFAAQLVRTLPVHAPRFATRPRLDLAQALKEQDTARIPGAHLGYLACHLVGGILIQAICMPPEITVAVFACDRPARLPLLLGDPLEMTIPMGVQTMIGHKDGLHDDSQAAHRDDGQIPHVQVHCHGNQLGILLALPHFLGFNFLDLGDVQFCATRPQDQGWALTLPVGFLGPGQRVTRGPDRISASRSSPARCRR